MGEKQQQQKKKDKKDDHVSHKPHFSDFGPSTTTSNQSVSINKGRSLS